MHFFESDDFEFNVTKETKMMLHHFRNINFHHCRNYNFVYSLCLRFFDEINIFIDSDTQVRKDHMTIKVIFCRLQILLQTYVFNFVYLMFVDEYVLILNDAAQEMRSICKIKFFSMHF